MITEIRTNRVVVIEPQLLFGRALAAVLAADPTITVLAVVRDPSDFTLPVGEAPPKLAIVGIEDGTQDVYPLFAHCRRRFPGTRLCALSGPVEAGLMRRCLAAGADGFIAKDVSRRDLITAVKLVAAGTPYVDPRVTGAALHRSLAGVN